jgi:hypothetical protein
LKKKSDIHIFGRKNIIKLPLHLIFFFTVIKKKLCSFQGEKTHTAGIDEPLQMDTHSTTIPVKLTLLFSTYIFFQDRNFPTVKQKSSRVKTKQVEKTTEKFFGFFFLPRNRKMSGFTAAPSHRFDFEKKRKNKN